MSSPNLQPQLSQSQSQQLILSPQLRQFLKLLQLSIVDLQTSVEQELIQNPVLEEIKDESPDSELTSDDNPINTSEAELEFDKKIDQMGAFDDDMRENLFRQTDFAEGSVSDLQKKKEYQDSILSKSPTLTDYLEWQIGLLGLDDDEDKIAQEIIGNINEDGYFVGSIDEIADITKSDSRIVEKILEAIQTMDPPGVGGRNLQEVLTLQLKRRKSNPLPIKIVESQFALLERKQFDQIAKALSTSPEHVSQACKLIGMLEPKPGRIFYQDEAISVVPDISIMPSEDNENEYDIEIHNERIPELRVNPTYRKMIKQKDIDPKTKAFLREKMQAAMMYIRALSERKSTLRRIAEEIIKAQKDFLDSGFAQLKPLRLRDIADKIGIHESTISRAIQGKYVRSPQGTIPLKSFFSNALAADNGEMESQKSVMEKIKNLVESEDPKKPLSDAKIVSLLKTDGIQVARRTIAKYRDLLKILPSHLRKTR